MHTHSHVRAPAPAPQAVSRAVRRFAPVLPWAGDRSEGGDAVTSALLLDVFEQGRCVQCVCALRACALRACALRACAEWARQARAAPAPHTV